MYRNTAIINVNFKTLGMETLRNLIQCIPKTGLSNALSERLL